MTFGDLLSSILALAIVGLVFSWFTILPALGLPYVFGWLS